MRRDQFQTTEAFALNLRGRHRRDFIRLTDPFSPFQPKKVFFFGREHGHLLSPIIISLFEIPKRTPPPSLFSCVIRASLFRLNKAIFTCNVVNYSKFYSIWNHAFLTTFSDTFTPRLRHRKAGLDKQFFLGWISILTGMCLLRFKPKNPKIFRHI